jgi:undecaprenyl pyrophosphate phosphatase UppP
MEDLGQPGQKVRETPSQSMGGCCAVCLSSPAMKGSTDKRTVVQASLGISETLFQVGVAQVVACLPGKSRP